MNDNKISNNYKYNFNSGKINREEFWTLINSNLNEIRKIQHLLDQKIAGVEVTNSNLVLNYQFWSNESIKLVIPENDIRTAAFSILANGHYESLLEYLILKLSEQSKLFLDIGANMGFYCIGASLLNRNLNIIAFEPNPVIKKSLNENIKLNHVENRIEILEFALSDFVGDATFSVPAFTGSGGGSLRNLHPEEGLPQEFSVKVEKLDNFQAKTKGADLFKIDVEGAEFQLIRGGLETIIENRPTIIVELLRKWMKPFQSTPQDVVELLSQQGYLCFAIGNTDTELISLINDSTKETNFVFCHPDNAEHLELIRKISEEN